MRRLLPIAASLCLAACGGERGDPEEPGCEPGAELSCPCEGGGAGTATCGEDGTPGPCACPGAVAWSPPLLDFGRVPGGAGREATLLVWTDGATAIPVTGATVDGHPGFAVVSAPAALPAGGGGVPVVVSFRSPTPVAAEGTLTVRTGAGEVSVPLRATVLGPAVACAPVELVWSDVPPGSSEYRVLTCRNGGLSGEGEPAVVELVDVEVDDPEFRPLSPPVSAGPGESFDLHVLYLPADLEDDLATARLRFEPALEVSIRLVGSAADELCELEVQESRTSGIPGQELHGSVRVRNRRTDAGCLLAGLEPEPGCHEGFSFSPRESLVLPPGGSLAFPYRFEADATGVYPCPVRVRTEDPAGSDFTGRAEVELSWRRCLVEEGPLTVPAISPSCGVASAEAWLVNECAGDFLVDGVRLVDGSSPELAVGPIEPATLAPHGRLAVPVTFDPDAEGSFFATFEVLSPLDPTPWTFHVTASTEPDDLFTDRDVQHRLVPVDVLVVIDNGAGMGPEAARLVTELGAAPEVLRGYDYHLAVTTTGLAPEASGGCPGGASGGEDGRLFPVDGSRPRVVTRATPDARAVWEGNLQVGSCHTAPARPLEAAALAVSPGLDVADDPRHPEADDGNAGFLRPGVPLVVLFVGDRDDASPGTPASYFDALVAAKNGDPMMVSTMVVAGDPGAGCVGSAGVAAAAGARLHQFAVAASAFETSICDDAWGFLNLFGEVLDSCFPVARMPADRNEDGTVDEADLEVRVGLAVVPPVAEDGVPNWAWNAATGTVCFSPRAVPPASALVEIERLYCPAP